MCIKKTMTFYRCNNDVNYNFERGILRVIYERVFYKLAKSFFLLKYSLIVLKCVLIIIKRC